MCLLISGGQLAGWINEASEAKEEGPLWNAGGDRKLSRRNQECTSLARELRKGDHELSRRQSLSKCPSASKTLLVQVILKDTLVAMYPPLAQSEILKLTFENVHHVSLWKG